MITAQTTRQELSVGTGNGDIRATQSIKINQYDAAAVAIVKRGAWKNSDRHKGECPKGTTASLKKLMVPFPQNKKPAEVLKQALQALEILDKYPSALDADILAELVGEKEIEKDDIDSEQFRLGFGQYMKPPTCSDWSLWATYALDGTNKGAGRTEHGDDDDVWFPVLAPERKEEGGVRYVSARVKMVTKILNLVYKDLQAAEHVARHLEEVQSSSRGGDRTDMILSQDGVQSMIPTDVAREEARKQDEQTRKYAKNFSKAGVLISVLGAVQL